MSHASCKRSLQTLFSVFETILPSRHYFVDGENREVKGPAPGLGVSTLIKLAFEPRLVFGPGCRLLADHSTSQVALHRPAIGEKPPLWFRTWD